MKLAVDIKDLTFSYKNKQPILSINELAIERGDRLFLYGPSGCGKTTLLSLLAGVLTADSGIINILGSDLSQLSGSRRDMFRAIHMGYIFQLFNLIPYLSVKENILLPCHMNTQRKAKVGSGSLETTVMRLARALDIETLLHENVLNLSVGQQQRVAAARAMIGAPEIIIADEPTSSLDPELREQFIQLLFKECEQAGSTLIFVSHDKSLAPLFKNQLSLPIINTV